MVAGCRSVEYGSKPLKKCLLADVGSRDGWGGCRWRRSIVRGDMEIPVWAARWAVEGEGSGGAEALLWPEPVEWDARSDFTAWTGGGAAGDGQDAEQGWRRARTGSCSVDEMRAWQQERCSRVCRPGWVAVVERITAPE